MWYGIYNELQKNSVIIHCNKLNQHNLLNGYNQGVTYTKRFKEVEQIDEDSKLYIYYILISSIISYFCQYLNASKLCSGRNDLALPYYYKLVWTHVVKIIVVRSPSSVSTSLVQPKLDPHLWPNQNGLCSRRSITAHIFVESFMK